MVTGYSSPLLAVALPERFFVTAFPFIIWLLLLALAASGDHSPSRGYAGQEACAPVIGRLTTLSTARNGAFLVHPANAEVIEDYSKRNTFFTKSATITPCCKGREVFQRRHVLGSKRADSRPESDIVVGKSRAVYLIITRMA
jgi:hypothetical protein